MSIVTTNFTATDPELQAAMRNVLAVIDALGAAREFDFTKRLKLGKPTIRTALETLEDDGTIETVVLNEKGRQISTWRRPQFDVDEFDVRHDLKDTLVELLRDVGPSLPSRVGSELARRRVSIDAAETRSTLEALRRDGLLVAKTVGASRVYRVPTTTAYTTRTVDPASVEHLESEETRFQRSLDTAVRQRWAIPARPGVAVDPTFTYTLSGRMDVQPAEEPSAPSPGPAAKESSADDAPPTLAADVLVLLNHIAEDTDALIERVQNLVPDFTPNPPGTLKESMRDIANIADRVAAEARVEHADSPEAQSYADDLEAQARALRSSLAALPEEPAMTHEPTAPVTPEDRLARHTAILAGRAANLPTLQADVDRAREAYEAARARFTEAMQASAQLEQLAALAESFTLGATLDPPTLPIITSGTPANLTLDAPDDSEPGGDVDADAETPDEDDDGEFSDLSPSGQQLLEWFQSNANPRKPYRVTEVIELTGMARATVTRELRDLVDLGYLERHTVPDSRAYEYRLVLPHAS